MSKICYKRYQIQVNGTNSEPEKIYLDELKDFCSYINECPTRLRSICRGQCERVGYVDCDMLNKFIKDYRGHVKWNKFEVEVKSESSVYDIQLQ